MVRAKSTWAADSCANILACLVDGPVDQPLKYGSRGLPRGPAADYLRPGQVIECIKTYTKEHSLDAANLIPLAMKAIHDSGGSRWIEEVELLMEDPDLFEWPLEDPLLCVAIAFMRKYANRWTDKVREKLALTDDDDQPTDWRKGRDNCGRQPAGANHLAVSFEDPELEKARQARRIIEQNTVVKLGPIVAIDWSRPVPLDQQ